MAANFSTMNMIDGKIYIRIISWTTKILFIIQTFTNLFIGRDRNKIHSSIQTRRKAALQKKRTIINEVILHDDELQRFISQ